MFQKKDGIYDKLDLTTEQKKQLEANKVRDREVMKASFEKMKSYRETLKTELMKPELDMVKINNIQSQIKTLQAEMLDNRLNSILKVRKILTPEQFTKFISHVNKRKFNHRKWAQ